MKYFFKSLKMFKIWKPNKQISKKKKQNKFYYEYKYFHYYFKVKFCLYIATFQMFHYWNSKLCKKFKLFYLLFKKCYYFNSKTCEEYYIKLINYLNLRIPGKQESSKSSVVACGNFMHRKTLAS